MSVIEMWDGEPRASLQPLSDDEQIITPRQLYEWALEEIPTVTFICTAHGNNKVRKGDCLNSEYICDCRRKPRLVSSSRCR